MSLNLAQQRFENFVHACVALDAYPWACDMAGCCGGVNLRAVSDPKFDVCDQVRFDFENRVATANFEGTEIRVEF